MRKSRMPSPARSQGAVTPTPRRKKSRGSRSVCSPALSTASGRLTSLIDQFKDKNADSFALSPLTGRSVLNDNTEIEEPRRRSWWKKLGENSQSAMEILDDHKVPEANNVIEDLEIEVLSQEKKNYTLDLPESSDNESINSIVLPQRRLFTQKENQPHNKFGQLMDNRENLAKLNKTNANVDKTVNAGTRELFQNAKRSKPIFPAALLQMSPNKTTADKTKENIVVDPKPQVRNIFGNRPANKKRKNIFANFIASDSEEEIPEIQPRVFGFQKKFEQRRVSTVSKATENSPMSSITTDMDMDGWKHLPSSTLVENQLEEIVGHTPVKRPRLSKLSEAKESETGITTMKTDTTGDKTKQSNKSVSSKNKSKVSPEIKNKTLDNSRVTRSALKNASKREDIVETPKADKTINRTTKDKTLNRSAPALEDIETHDVSINKSLNKNRTRTIVKVTETDNNINISIPAAEDVETHEISTNQSINKNRTRTIVKGTETDNNINISIPAPDNVETHDTSTNKSVTKNKTRMIIEEHESDKYNEKEHDVSNISLNKNRTRTIVKEPESDDKNANAEVTNNEKDNKTTKKIVSKIPVAVKSRKEEENAELQKPDNIERNDDEDDENNFSLQYEDDVNEVQIVEPNNADNNRQDKSTNQNSTVIEKSSKQKGPSLDKQKVIEESNELEAMEQHSAHDNVDGHLENAQKTEDIHNESKGSLTKVKESKNHMIIQNDEKENMKDKVDKDQVNENSDELNEIQENVVGEEDKNIDDSANKSKVCEEAEESQEADKSQAEDANEGEEKANETQEVEEEADESQEIEEEADDGQESDEEADQSQEVEEEANDSQEVEKAEESQEIEEAEESQEADVSQETADEGEEENEEHEEQESDNEITANENQDDESDAEVDASQEVDDQEMDDSDEADKAIASDNDMSDDAAASDNDTPDDAADDMEVDDDDNQQESNNDLDNSEQNVSQEQNNAEPSDEVIEESPNVTHDTTGRNRKKDYSNKSPEAILQGKTDLADSFMAKGRNTSIRNTKSMIKNLHIRPSLAPARDSIGFSDGTKDSSAEGSGWDSHRTTRKTLRQTFGKDFTPRKSLRALVMEKSAKRQTEHIDLHSETVRNPQANSTELPEMSNRDDIENIDVSNHEVSMRTRQATLETYLENIKQQNIEKKLKMEEAVRNSLKNPTRDTLSLFKVPSKPAPRRPKPAQSKPKKQLNSIIPFDELPSEVIQDMKYKPPKRFQPTNAAWITKRLYKYLETKLEPKYDYKARIRAEQLVEKIYYFAKDIRRHDVAPADAVEVLKHELARLDVVTTHFEFYEFFHDFMPREVRVKVVPDIVNKIPLPRHGVFSNILREYQVQG